MEAETEAETVPSEPAKPVSDQSAKLLQELQRIEDRILKVLDLGAATLSALADASETGEEALSSFTSNASEYYKLLQIISGTLRSRIDAVLAMGILPHVANQPSIPFLPNLYGEEMDLELRAKALHVVKEELQEVIQDLEAAVSGEPPAPEDDPMDASAEG
ncbi:hypothetical protein DFJ74DRAFT_710876 [Hyaloraphidium curvatum]|nr:hypothetical protein DFJ74DRAFT_710876 [Hyaloraphidium curvatum]